MTISVMMIVAHCWLAMMNQGFMLPTCQSFLVALHQTQPSRYAFCCSKHEQSFVECMGINTNEPVFKKSAVTAKSIHSHLAVGAGALNP